LGEVPLFTALYDSPQQLNRLLHLLDLQLMEILRQMADLPSIYVEFGDNLDGTMTNPKLFKEYSLPYYQKYTDILHGQGKKVGSHTDGNVKPLLSLLAQSGLDVCESFSPAPLTECTFEEAWETWRHGPLIWGGVPSPILEKRTSESEFRDYIHRLLEIIENRNIILGVGDMVLGNNLIERVEYIAKEVEHHRLV
jgi:uroporphyrinogen-III decarboxylase